MPPNTNRSSSSCESWKASNWAGRMRVTHVITRLVIGGAQENTVASVLGLRQRPDFQVHLISGPTTGPEGSLTSLFRQEPGLLTVLPTLVRAIHPLYDLATLFRLTRIFQATAPQIVHTHSGKAGISDGWPRPARESPSLSTPFTARSFRRLSRPRFLIFCSTGAERRAAGRDHALCYRCRSHDPAISRRRNWTSRTIHPNLQRF